MSQHPKLTREQQHTLAREVIQWVASMTDGRDCPELAGMDPIAVREQLARWMDRLPGQAWDTRLPDPTTLCRGGA